MSFLYAKLPETGVPLLIATGGNEVKVIFTGPQSMRRFQEDLTKVFG